MIIWNGERTDVGVGIFLLYFCQHLPYLKNIEYDSRSFWRYFPWIHDRFMRMLHDIFHSMENIEELCFYGIINVSTQSHNNILKFISCLKSNINETSYPVVDWFSMCLFKLFKLLSNEWSVHEDIFQIMCLL